MTAKAPQYPPKNAIKPLAPPPPPPKRIYKDCFGILVLQNVEEIAAWTNSLRKLKGE